MSTQNIVNQLNCSASYFCLIYLRKFPSSPATAALTRRQSSAQGSHMKLRHAAEIPPLTLIACPVIRAASSEQRNAMVAATSSASATPSDASFARSEEHTSELQSLMRISYAVFCLKKKKTQTNLRTNILSHYNV